MIRRFDICCSLHSGFCRISYIESGFDQNHLEFNLSMSFSCVLVIVSALPILICARFLLCKDHMLQNVRLCPASVLLPCLVHLAHSPTATRAGIMASQASQNLIRHHDRYRLHLLDLHEGRLLLLDPTVVLALVRKLLDRSVHHLSRFDSGHAEMFNQKPIFKFVFLRLSGVAIAGKADLCQHSVKLFLQLLGKYVAWTRLVPKCPAVI